MDYYSMKRKELQALCKKNKIPANSANSVLADKLSQLLNEKQIPITQQRNCLKSPVETADECEPVVSRRQAKKVRFSPTNEVVEYELRNGKKQMAMATETRARRKSVAKKVDGSVVDNVINTANIVDDGVQAPVKLTRSRVQLLEKDGVVLNNGKKQGRRAVKDVKKGTDSVKEPEVNLGRVTRLKVQTLGERGAIQVDENKQGKRSRNDSEIASESAEEHVVARVKVTRSKTQDFNPQVQKKRGRPQVAKDVKNVEPPKEIMDIPVRMMRSSRQTIKEDIGSIIANPRVEKKRTRGEMKSTDLSDNLSNVASKEKQKPPKRKSLRTKGIEVVDELEDEIVEVINDSRVTRSKAPAMKPSGRNTRSKAENKVEGQRKSKRVQQLEEPLEHVGKENVSRRKSVMQPGKIEEVLHFKESVNHPATREKSMMQKAPGKEIDKPLVGMRGSVNETNIAESPTVGTRKTVGRKQSKGQSNNPSTIKEGLDDTENVIKQGKDASENEMEAVANATRSPKSRKRNRDPIIEDHIETESASPVDASSRRSTHSDSRSKGKAVTYSPQSSVAKKQLGSILKTRASSGAIIRDGSSKKRAKLSRTKINESEDHAEKSNKVGTPVLKSVNFDLDEKVADTECSPGIDGSHRRFTGGAIMSDRKEPSQSAIKKRRVGDAQLSLHKVTKFTHDPAVNTAPGRVTRSGIKLIENLASTFSEKSRRTNLKESDDHAQKTNAVGTSVLKSVNFDLDEKVTGAERTPGIGGSHRRSTRSAVISDRKEPSQSAIKKQPVGDAQLSLYKVTKFTHDPAVKTTPGRVTRSGFKHRGNAATSFSEKLSRTKLNESEDHAEKYNTEGTPVLKLVNFDLDEKVLQPERTPDIGGSHRRSTRGAVISAGKEPSQSAIKEQPIGDTRLSSHRVTVTKFRHDPAVNTAPSRVTRGAIKRGVNVSVSFSERIDKTKQLSESAHKNQSLEDAQMFSPEVVEVRPNPDLAAGVQSGTSIEVMGLLSEDEGDFSAAGSVRLLTKVGEEDTVSVSETAGVTENLSSLFARSDDRVKDAGEDMEAACDYTEKVSVELASSAAEVELTDSGSMLKELPTDVTVDESVVSVGKTVVMNESVDISIGVTVEENNSDADNKCVSNPHKAGSSPIHLVSFKQSDNTIKSKEVETPVGSLAEDIGYAQIEKESEQDVSTCRDSLLCYTDKPEASNNSEHDDEDERASTQMQVMNEPVFEDNQLFDVDKRYGAEDVVDAGKELAEEPEFERVPSTGNDFHEIPMLYKSDGVDGIDNCTKECGTDSMPIIGDNMPSYGEDLLLNGEDAEDEAFTANREHESNLKPLPDDDSDKALFGKDDDVNITRLFEPTSEPTSSNDMIETLFSGNDTYGESDNDNQIPHLQPLTGNDDVQDEVNILPKELEAGLETSNSNSGLEVPVAGNNVDADCVMDERSDGQDGESEYERLASNATSTMDEQYVGVAGLVPAPNENMPVVTEVLSSSDLEPEPVSNVSVGKVSCDTDVVCAPVGHSASTMSMEAPQTPAVTTIAVDACEESIPDINKDAQIFGDIYGLENAQRVTDTENDSLSELKGIGISGSDEGSLPKGSGIASPDMSIKQITEETEMKTENDHASTDKTEHTVSTIDHDLDSAKFVEDFPNHGVDQLELFGNIKAHEISTTEELSGQLMGDLGDRGRLFANESLSMTYRKEESPVGDTLSDSPTSAKDDDRNKQDDRIIGLQTSGRATSSIEDIYSPAADFVNSEKKSEQGSRNVVDREFNQDADMLKEKTNANMTEEIFNWPDSSLKALFTKPTTTASSHLKEGQQDAASFDFPDGSHDEDIGRIGTPTLDSNHHGDSESARVFNALSLETLFTTPATTQIAHVIGGQMENESSEVFNGKKQVFETQGHENVINRVPNYENFYNKYFRNEEVDGSSDRSGEFKGDQYDLSSEAARTDHLEASGLKDNSIRGGMPEKKEINCRGPETGGDFGSDKGTREI